MSVAVGHLTPKKCEVQVAQVRLQIAWSQTCFVYLELAKDFLLGIR
jgi:hypothetical protein